MNEMKEETLEKLIRNAIFYDKDELRKITIMEATVSLEAAEIASQSKNIETLMEGLGHCHFIQRSIEEIQIIRYDEIGSSEEKIKSLENEIKWKLFISGGFIVMREIGGGRIEEVGEEEEVSFLYYLIFKVLAEGLDY